MQSDDLLPRLQQHFGDAIVIERELGGGGMSRVVLGRDDRLGRRVVVKVLPPGVTASISAERFEREIMLAAAMQHPNIVPVLSAGRLDGLPYFVMPFIEGESLRGRMARGPLSVRETVNILKDVTRALQFAHGRGVIHRDIKPDNVLLTAGGAAVVTDFGVAKALSASASNSGRKLQHVSVTGIGMSPGTPAYMSPEQAAADPATDHRTDLYSLGILAYEMLVGAPPFAGRSPQALLAAQLSEVPPPITSRRYDVPVALDRLLAQCLAKDPVNRPASASTLLRSLEDPEMVSGVFASPMSDRRWWQVKGPARVGLGVAALSVVAAVAWIAAAAAGAGEGAQSDSAAAVPASAAAPTTSRSVVVIPLASLGADTSARQVAEAMTSALGVAAAQASGWRVTSTANLRALGDSALAPAAAARALSITHFIDGSVQRERSAVRVSLRLVRAANDSTVWARTFDGAWDRQLALQDSVSQAVIQAMNGNVR